MTELSTRTRLAFVIPFIGTWPRWSGLFFQSCRTNPVVDILLVCETPPPVPTPPPNVRVILVGRQELFARLEKATGLSLGSVSGHKLCDFRPFFGLAFADLLKPYEFWGFCDMDLMFGDLGKLLTDEFLDSLDCFSAHDQRFAGHFTILRNIPAINQLGFKILSWQPLCLAPLAEHVDEERFSDALQANGTLRWRKPEPLSEELKKPFGAFGITFTPLGNIADLDPAEKPMVQWKNGQVHYFDPQGGRTEVLYVHFMGLKRWWHWLFFGSHQPTSTEHSFSRIGYGGVQTAAGVARFPWQQLYWAQTSVERSGLFVGRLFKKIIPANVFLSLRRKLKV